MNLEIDLIDGLVSVDGEVAWRIGALNPPVLVGRPVRYLDLPAKLVIDAGAGSEQAVFVLFDEEEFPESIHTSRIVKRFAKKTGITPELVARSQAVSRFPWGEIEFSVDPKQGDLSIAVRDRVFEGNT
ncbi:hypothetical protein PV762_27775 [Mitsuaria sp. CC2]|uniref:hypothetical protein n=1 Tax=Mitsuaria sp. CC2 TaxID=3029186 RepID=UPI003B8E2ED0